MEVLMARFQFELDGVLRQRKNAEHIAQQKVAEAMKGLIELQEQLKRLDEGVKAVTEDVRNNHLTGEIDVGFITQHRRYILSMERNALELARHIADAQSKVRQAQQQLVESAKQRKIMEKLRDKQFERFMADQMKKENETLDEAGMQIAFENIKESYGPSAN
jgi:flagellar protein FliJ